jgi:hypothetical protein
LRLTVAGWAAIVLLPTAESIDPVWTPMMAAVLGSPDEAPPFSSKKCPFPPGVMLTEREVGAMVTAPLVGCSVSDVMFDALVGAIVIWEV